MPVNRPVRLALAVLLALALATCSDETVQTPGAGDAGQDEPDAEQDAADTGCSGAGCDDAQEDAGEDTPDLPCDECDVAPDGCGDGAVQDDEACDDGELNGAHGSCAADCSGPGPRCGDGVMQAGVEKCDHGEANGLYGHCAEDCSGLGDHCGDGELQAPEEACDDGERNGEAGACRDDCSGHTLDWTRSPDPAAAVLLDRATCDPHDWLGKYMRYRRRLRGDGTARFPGFVSVGLAPGESLPASRRERHADCAGHWSFEACPRTDDPDARGIYKWGDGTVWLGTYLEVLATERAMFSELGLDTTETDSDLYQALMALNRLDEGAEAFYGVPPARDGYFLRDDVPRGFMTLSDGVYRFPRDDDGLQGYECVGSDISCETPRTDDGSFTSQDQVIGLLHGLALVVRLLPEGTSVEGLELPGAAREMVHRMVWHLRDNGWRVTAPDGDHPPNAWGGNAIAFSNQLAKSANALCGSEFGVDDYRNLASRVEGQAVWNGLQAIWGITHNYNRTMALRLAAITSEWSPDKMAGNAVGDDKDYFALTFALLNGVDLDDALSHWRIESVLDSAPCGGPCRGYDACEEAPGWKGENRIMGPGDRSGSRHHPLAEFNGLDYMALHNAYFLYRRGRTGFLSPEEPAECGHFTSLAELEASPSVGATYDPFDDCVAIDFEERFCGRPWASWLDDAYAGRVTVFTGTLRWQCDDGLACVLVASDGNTTGDDLILGGDGDDELYGAGGNDCLVGFGGSDLLEGGQGYDELHGGEGDDDLFGESSGLVLDGERDRLFGGPGDDSLKGGPDNDALYGGEGNDVLVGDGGADILEGGSGDDTLRGNSGDDTLTGGAGNDSLIGDAGDDVLWGGPGRDKLDGEGGSDYCNGEGGDDFVRGGAGDDSLIAGEDGADRLCGNGGDDVLWGGWDGDQCRGGGFLGGTDQVMGCEDDTASQDECNNSAFDAW